MHYVSSYKESMLYTHHTHGQYKEICNLNIPYHNANIHCQLDAIMHDKKLYISTEHIHCVFNNHACVKWASCEPLPVSRFIYLYNVGCANHKI